MRAILADNDLHEFFAEGESAAWSEILWIPLVLSARLAALVFPGMWLPFPFPKVSVFFIRLDGPLFACVSRFFYQ